MSPNDTRRLEAVRTLLSKNGITLDALYDVRRANMKQPYHNEQHLFIVTLASAAGAEYYDLTPRQKRVLVLAALYHDYNHTGKIGVPDSVNIELAVEGVENFLRLEGYTSITHKDADAVKALIHATLHPNKKRPASISEAIIRDADMMEWFEPDAEELLVGLNEELKPDSPFTMKTTEAFLRKHSFLTQWGMNLFQETFPFTRG